MADLTPQAFAEKWGKSRLSERSAYQQHFLALREHLEAKRQANRETRRIIAGLIERVPALEAPHHNGQEDAQEPPSGTGGVDGEGPQEGSGRSWWRRLFGG